MKSIRAIRVIRGSSNPFLWFVPIRVNSCLTSYTLALRVRPAAASLLLLPRSTANPQA